VGLSRLQLREAFCASINSNQGINRVGGGDSSVGRASD
jgi:hypothetical protein